MQLEAIIVKDISMSIDGMNCKEFLSHRPTCADVGLISTSHKPLE